MKRFFGILSMIQVGGALGIGLWVMWQSSLTLALAYIFFAILGAILVTYTYCAKCPCRAEGCAHVLPGAMTRLYPARRQSSYALWEYIIVAAVVGGLVFVPALWLVGQWGLLTIFGVLVVSAVVEIRAMVCRRCDNSRCPLCGAS